MSNIWCWDCINYTGNRCIMGMDMEDNHYGSCIWYEEENDDEEEDD